MKTLQMFSHSKALLGWKMCANDLCNFGSCVWAPTAHAGAVKQFLQEQRSQLPDGGASA